MTNDNKKRKIKRAIMPLLLAAILSLLLISSVLAGDYNDTSAGKSARINILNLFDENGQIITDETGLINLELTIRSENIGIQSVNFTVTSDGQSGQEYVIVQATDANGIKMQEPPVNWAVQEANAENIISLGRIIETYALQTLAVELGFTDINGNYYSEQYYGTVASQITDMQQEPESETEFISQEECAVSEQNSEVEVMTDIDAMIGTEELTEAEVLNETETLTEADVITETEVLTEAEVLSEAEAITETETMIEAEVMPEAEAIIETEMLTEVETMAEAEETNEEEGLTETEIMAETEVGNEPEVITETGEVYETDSAEQTETGLEIVAQEKSGTVETAAESEIVTSESGPADEENPTLVPKTELNSAAEQASEVPLESETVAELESEINAEQESEPESELESVTEAEFESELQTTIPEISTESETTAAAAQEIGSNIQYVYVPQYVYKPTAAASAGTYSAASSNRTQSASSQSLQSQPEKTSVSEANDNLINDAKSKAEELKAEADSLEKTTQETTREQESKHLNKEGSSYDLSAIEGINGRSLKETGDIVICEQNMDKLVEDSIRITVSKNDETYELEKDTDYSVMLTGNSKNKKIYKYTVNADTFKEDGRYKIFIYSEDESGNTNSNEIKDSSIEFSVDNTNPLIISCADTADEEEIPGELIIKDNIRLDEVDIYVDDQKVDYNVDGDTYSFNVPQTEQKANVKVVAKDSAGNVYERTFEGYKAAGNIAVKSRSNAAIIIAVVIFIAAAGILSVKIMHKRRRTSENECV